MNLIIIAFLLVFIGVGILLFAGLFSLAKLNNMFRGWWSLFVIVPAAVNLTKRKHKYASLFLLIFGIALLLQQLNIIGGNLIWRILLAGLLIIFLTKIMYLDKKNNEAKENLKVNNGIYFDNIEKCDVIFSEQKRKYTTDKFLGAKFNSIFGTMEFDLSEVLINKNVIIEISLICAECTIIVPENININIIKNEFFSKISNEICNEESCFITIYVLSSMILGELKIKKIYNDVTLIN